MVIWDRQTLKARAKDVLRKNYWTAFLLMLLYGIVTGVVTFSFRFEMEWPFNGWQGTWQSFGQALSGVAEYIFSLPFLGLLAGFSFVAMLFGLAYKVFVANVLEVGKDRFFNMSRYNAVNFEDILQGFRNGFYMSNVKTLFFRDLYIFLWSLLFIIPGIVKSFAYFMVPYIIAENPNIPTQRALEISEKATQGEKGEIFVLYLSFIGWFLLGAIACGVGTLFVQPYFEATKAELYGALRYKAVTNGICTKQEIGAEL